MATKKTKKTKTSKQTKVGRLSYKDVEVAFFAHGVDAVKALIENKKVTVTMAQRAVDDLTKIAPNSVGPLKAFLEAFAPAKPTRQGRDAPTVGTERDYSTQNLGQGSFMRLPLETLGALKGEKVTVRFEDGRLIVVKKAAKALKQVA